MAATSGAKGGLLTYGGLVQRVMRGVDTAMERRRWNPMTREIVHRLVLDTLQDNGDPFAEIGDPFGPPGNVEGV